MSGYLYREFEKLGFTEEEADEFIDAYNEVAVGYPIPYKDLEKILKEKETE